MPLPRILRSALTLVGLVSSVAFSGTPALPRGGELISFEHIPIPKSGIVNCAVRDDRGFLWFGTTKGLCKYDGYRMRMLAVGSSVPLSGNVPGHDRQVVSAIIKQPDGSLLLGTGL